MITYNNTVCVSISTMTRVRIMQLKIMLVITSNVQRTCIVIPYE